MSLKYTKSGIIMIDVCNKKVLLVRNKICNKYGFPKGSIDRKTDKSYKDCALREFNEETSFNIGSQLIKDNMWIILDKIYFYIVVCDFNDYKPPINIKNNEIDKVLWHNINELDKKDNNINLYNRSLRQFINTHIFKNKLKVEFRQVIQNYITKISTFRYQHLIKVS